MGTTTVDYDAALPRNLDAHTAEHAVMGLNKNYPYILSQDASPIIILPSGTVNGTGQFTFGTGALPYLPTGTVKVYVFAGVGLTAGLYDATFSSTSVCQLAGNPATTSGAYAGGTSEATLKTITIPGGTLGAYGALRVVAEFGAINNANIKTPRVRAGGATNILYSAGLANWASLRAFGMLRNKGSEALNQYGFNNLATGFGQGSATPNQSTIDTSQAFDLTITTQLANAADYAFLDAYTVEVLPASSSF